MTSKWEDPFFFEGLLKFFFGIPSKETKGMRRMLVELKVGYIVFEMLVFHRGCELITFCKERIVINERHIARKAQYEALVRVRVDVYGCFLKLNGGTPPTPQNDHF